MTFQPGQSGNPAGRPRGTGDKRVTARDERLRALSASLGKVIPEAFDGDAHALLTAMYKDPRMPLEVRKDAAAIAIKFEKPALASTHTTLNDETVLTPAQRQQRIRELLAELGGPLIEGSSGNAPAALISQQTVIVGEDRGFSPASPSGATSGQHASTAGSD